MSEITSRGWTDGYFNYKVLDGGEWWNITKHLPMTLWTHSGSFNKDWSKKQVEEWFEEEERSGR